MKTRYLFIVVGALFAGYNHTKDITVKNETDGSIVLKITPGRISKLLSPLYGKTRPDDIVIDPQASKKIPVYSEQIMGRGDYIKDLQIAWRDKDDINLFSHPEVDLRTLNAFIHSNDYKKAISITWIPEYDRTTYKEIEGKGNFKVVIPDVPEVTQKLREEDLKTRKQVLQAAENIKRIGKMWLGSKKEKTTPL
jgi:hypothetical protein